MALSTKGVNAKKRIKLPLYKLTNEDLVDLEKNADAYRVKMKINEVLTLRRNIDLLSQSNPFEDMPPQISQEASRYIASCFFSSFTSLPFLFLSEESFDKEKPAYPISFYVRIDKTTTLDQIKEYWKEIKYWSDYIYRAQGLKMGGQKDKILFDLHTKNLEGKGYGSLSKDVNEKLERLLRQDILTNKWRHQFESEFLEYFNDKPGRSAHFSKIKNKIRVLFLFSGDDFGKELFDRIYKEAPMKSLMDLPKEDPFKNRQAHALNLLKALGFNTRKSQEYIKESLKELSQGRTIKKMVTGNKIREVLRWWRKENGCPSPGEMGMG